jgi:hypothetical protein
VSRRLLILLTLLMLLPAAACQRQPVCPQPTGTPDFLTVQPSELATPAPAIPAQVEINGKTMQVDKVVEGPLCNDTWSGIVYVTCDVQVYEWEELPLFLKDCDLEIKPGTVVYVADHNDTAYYNGCSCHVEEETNP